MVSSVAKRGAALVNNAHIREKQICVVIDAGHGGRDSGKVGINNVLEKDINLEISRMLKALLEQEGILVVMTREDDNGLYSEETRNKKVEDMRKRVEIISGAKPLFAISIHQNSYPEEAISGPQVFYYGQSKEGRQLAECIQKQMTAQLCPSGERQAKANESYYMLKKTGAPSVIVECGFLSNSREAALLASREYQEKVAKAVAEGALEYIGSLR